MHIHIHVHSIDTRALDVGLRGTEGMGLGRGLLRKAGANYIYIYIHAHIHAHTLFRDCNRMLVKNDVVPLG